MLDSDLARLYGVATKALNQAVRRNHARFPSDFMLILSKEEVWKMRSRFVTASRRNARYRPCAFTEHGVAMLSSVLRSPRAIAANIAIMRAFVRYREALALNRDLALKLDELESRVDRHDGEIGAVLDAIRGIVQGPRRSKRRIGFNSEPH